jgi:hypothetical protein
MISTTDYGGLEGDNDDLDNLADDMLFEYRLDIALDSSILDLAGLCDSVESILTSTFAVELFENGIIRDSSMNTYGISQNFSAGAPTAW